MTRFRKFVWLRDTLWLTLLAVYIFAGLRSVPFHGDESTTLWMSRDFYYFAIEHDFDRLRYNETPISATEQQMRLVAAPVPKYILGLAWTLNGYTADDINDQWLWGAGWDYNLENGHIPSDDLLITARWASAILLFGSVICLFHIGRILGGKPVAYLATLYYALNPAILLNGRRAMLEGTTLFFALLVVLAGLWLLRHRTWWATLLLGFASGLAIASKHPTLFTVSVVFVTIGGYTIYRSLQDEERLNSSDNIAPPTIAPDDPYALLTMIFVAGIIALAVFFAVNPAWWDDPIARVSETADIRMGILNTQVDLFGGYSDFGDQIGGFFRQVFVIAPQYYESPDWVDMLPITDQIAEYENTLWTGFSFGQNRIVAMGLVILTVCGGWILIGKRNLRRSVRLMMIVWVITIFFSTALLTPLEWARYYLLAHVPVALLASLAVWEIMRRLIYEMKKLQITRNNRRNA